MSKCISSCVLVAVFAASGLFADPALNAGGPQPVSPNIQGKENCEWSQSTAEHCRDGRRNLPRVLLVGDSITAQYWGNVRDALEGKMNVTYWASSWCITRPIYRKFLEGYLSEAEYAIVHINSGGHSFQTDMAAWKKALKETLLLIREKQPKAKLVWSTTTPMKKAESTAKSKELNAAAAEVIAEIGGVDAVDDQFALVSAYDKEEPWSDGVHLKYPVRVEQGKQIGAQCLKLLGK